MRQTGPAQPIGDPLVAGVKRAVSPLRKIECHSGRNHPDGRACWGVQCLADVSGQRPSRRVIQRQRAAPGYSCRLVHRDDAQGNRVSTCEQRSDVAGRNITPVWNFGEEHQIAPADRKIVSSGNIAKNNFREHPRQLILSFAKGKHQIGMNCIGTEVDRRALCLRRLWPAADRDKGTGKCAKQIKAG